MARRRGKHSGLDTRQRHLHVEPLEDRRMLAVATVDTELDVVDLGDGLTSLREAIFAANTLLGPDTIEFDPSLAGKTILLTQGELEITDELTINGLGADQLTIDAQQQSRIFNISAPMGDFTIAGMTLTRGLTTGDNADDEDTTFSGGAVRSITDGLLTIEESVISGSATTGDYAPGGGVFVYGYIEVTNTMVHGNSTAGYASRGGGIAMHVRQFDYVTPGKYGALTLTDSVVTDNHTTGLHAHGGELDAFSRTIGFIPAIKNAGIAILNRSEVSHNSTSGSGANGGGISATGDVRLDHSHVDGNSSMGVLVTGGDGGPEEMPPLIHSGGGIFSRSFRVELTDSSVRDNFTTGLGGGGISARRGVTINRSTVSGNTSTGTEGDGGGIRVSGNFQHGTTITESTISGNSTAGRGGGIYVNGREQFFPSSITISQSTISGNSAGESGGGLFLEASTEGGITELSHNTITDNTSELDGGGFYVRGGTASVVHTILSGNADNSGTAPDVAGNIDGSFNLIGDTTGGTITGSDNLLNVDPLLGSLDNHGGPTLTHALLPGSPAIDMGDPSAAAGVDDVPEFDQRGNNFGRVQNGRIDIGAFELRDTLSADFDSDGLITGLDFLLWQIGLGTTVPGAVKTDGDADNDLDVDASDLDVWEVQYESSTALLADFDNDIDVDGFDFLVLQRGLGSAYDSSDLTAWEDAYGTRPPSPPLVAVVGDDTARRSEGNDTPGQSERAAQSSATALALHAKLVDLAQAVESAGDTADVEEPPVENEQPALRDVTTDIVFATNAVVPVSIAKDVEPRAGGSHKTVQADHPWLTDELLQRVFG